MINGASKFILLAIPLFCSPLPDERGRPDDAALQSRLPRWVGHWRGGFAQVNVVNSVLVGGVSGSSSADAAMDSKMLVPQMVRHGYSAAFQLRDHRGLGDPAQHHPAVDRDADLRLGSRRSRSSSCFSPATITGLVLAATLMVCVWAISVRRGYATTMAWVRMARRRARGVGAIPVLVLPVLIVGASATASPRRPRPAASPWV
jgi:TRAP-type C4-dicarboxylate transport system permease large subunit